MHRSRRRPAAAAATTFAGNGKRLARARDGGGQLHDRDERRQQQLRRHGEQSGQPDRGPGNGKPAGHECQRAGRHDRRHERDRHQVGRRRDERQPAEREQRDRQRRRLGRQRDAESLAQRRPEAEGTRSPSQLGEWRAPRPRARPWPRPRAGSRRRATVAGSSQQHDRDGPGQADHDPRPAAALDGRQGHAGHERGPHDRRRRAGEERVGDDRADRDDRPAGAADEAAQQGRHGRGHDGDVPARDGDDVADAGRREGRGQVPIHAVAQADQDRRGQAALRLGQDPLERVAGGLAQRLEPARERVVVAHQRQVRALDRWPRSPGRRGSGRSRRRRAAARGRTTRSMSPAMSRG